MKHKGQLSILVATLVVILTIVAFQSSVQTDISTHTPLIIITGQEDSAEDFHMLALNVASPDTDHIHQTIQGRIDDINAQGGIAIIAHPNAPGYTVTEAELKALKGYLGIEVGYTTPPTKWDAVLTDRVEKDEPLIWGFMTDDAHREENIGSRFIVLRMTQPSKDSVLAALIEGNFYWGDAPLIKNISLSDKTITITLASKANIKFIKQGGQVVKTVTGTSGVYNVIGDEGYIRVDVESRSPYYQRAGTQPFRITDALNINNPYSSSGNWYKGNLHCHSTISDGELSPEELIRLYEEEGYSFLAITDHVSWSILTE